ncbi:magnesium transporter NIPA4-like isoform X3 [Dermacentor albipictus]|uniref:magnesium transporter NIPA4-like isoform X3 n=1 Tax=Dermacentor albipictus TaxID=60249 RepID=UPI0031FC02E0
MLLHLNNNDNNNTTKIHQLRGAMLHGGGDAAAATAQRVVCWSSGDSEDVQAQSGTYLGLVLAFANVFFNASSFVIKKHALRRLVEGDERGVINPHGGLQLRFLFDPVWLVGAMLGSSADVAQGLALQFTSSTLVVAIGMGNGLVTAVLTATLLREPTSLLVVSSCILTIVGTVLMVLGVPAEMEPMTAMELELYLAQTGTGAVRSGAHLAAVLMLPAPELHRHHDVAFPVLAGGDALSRLLADAGRGGRVLRAVRLRAFPGGPPAFGHCGANRAATAHRRHRQSSQGSSSADAAVPCGAAATPHSGQQAATSEQMTARCLGSDRCPCRINTSRDVKILQSGLNEKIHVM